MPLSGSIPEFNVGLVAHSAAPTIPAFAGSVSGAFTTLIGDESLPQFLRRAVGVLGTVSGILATAPAPASGLQAVSDASMSGLRDLQMELVARVADMEVPSDMRQSVRLAGANAILTASGEVVFGS